MKEKDSWKTFERTGRVSDYLNYKSSMRENDANSRVNENAKQDIKEAEHERFCGTYRDGTGRNTGGGIR